MKRLLIGLCLCLLMVFPVAAGSVTYSDNAGEFIFAEGSEHSPTDLFENFKDVMPGDHLTQTVTVKNEAKRDVKVRIYLRSRGAHSDSADFLSQLRLTVKPSEDNTMAYMFDAAADKTAGLTDWVCLGTLYSGGEVSLDVTLDVPVTLDNQYSNAVGYLDWEFRVQEFPVDPTDPKPPQTGDRSDLGWWVAAAISAVTILLIVVFRRRER